MSCKENSRNKLHLTEERAKKTALHIYRADSFQSVNLPYRDHPGL